MTSIEVGKYEALGIAIEFLKRSMKRYGFEVIQILNDLDISDETMEAAINALEREYEKDKGGLLSPQG